MKRIAVVLLLMVNVSVADDPLQCVDPNFRLAFLPGYPGQTQYSTELPDGFVEHVAPSSSELIGSQVNDSYASVIYRVDVDSDLAMTGIVSSLEERGWQKTESFTGSARRGFQVSTIPDSQSLCHDDRPGMVSVSSRLADGSTMVTVSAVLIGNIQSCRELMDRSRYFDRHMGLAEEVPNLKLPEGVRSHNSGSGGGGNDYQTSVIVTTKVSRESVVSFLNDQIRDQGWGFDGEWVGNRSSGTAWYKESANGDLMIGTLHAFGEAGQAFNLRFSINLADTERYAGAGAISIRSQ